ncbi:MAG: cob(I)yrinic acid a,c-diamide adenosyltransferase, partial [Bacillota bacterium]
MEKSGTEQRGLVLVYTGNGKGKTTAALGLALRAIGHGKEVYMIQFLKGPGNEYGERRAAREYLKSLTIVPSGRDEFVNRKNPSEADMNLAARGMDLAREIVKRGRHGLVILDEINVAIEYGLVKVEEVIELIKSRPAHV